MGCALCRWRLTIAHFAKICDSRHLNWEKRFRFLVPKLVIVVTPGWCVHFWHLGGPCDDPSARGSTRRNFGVYTLISQDFGWFAGPHFGSFLGTLDRNGIFSHACFQVSFSVGFRVLFWIQNKYLLWEAFQQAIFRRTGS